LFSNIIHNPIHKHYLCPWKEEKKKLWFAKKNFRSDLVIGCTFFHLSFHQLNSKGMYFQINSVSVETSSFSSVFISFLQLKMFIISLRVYFLSVGQVHPDCWMISVAAQMPTLTQSLMDFPNANWAKNPPTNASPRS
jgi:hypothetical protein